MNERTRHLARLMPEQRRAIAHALEAHLGAVEAALQAKGWTEADIRDLHRAVFRPAAPELRGIVIAWNAQDDAYGYERTNACHGEIPWR